MASGRYKIMDWPKVLADEFENENPAEPQNDQALAEKYDVSISVIFRWRRELGIESAHARRRTYRANGGSPKPKLKTTTKKSTLDDLRI